MTAAGSTIVVGGGMAGMSCALRLKEHGLPVTLVTDFLGGRVYYSERTKMNFGAVFYMENYKNARKILTPGPRLAFPMSQIELHSTESDFFCAQSFRMIRQLPQLLRFKRYMKRFMLEYSVFKSECETIPVKQALENHPSLKKLYHQKATDVIRDIGIESIAADLVSKFAYACTGARVAVLNGLDYLNTVQGLVIPIHDFTFNPKAFAERIGGAVVIDSVSGVTRGERCHTVTTVSGKTLSASNVVIATPAHITQKIFDIGPIRSCASLWSVLVTGKAKPPYDRTLANYFSDKFDMTATVHRKNTNEYQVYARNRLDLSRYFENPVVVKEKYWDAALFVQGDIILDQDMGGGLYLAGDHNGLGMEPAAISGVFAANSIISRAG